MAAALEKQCTSQSDINTLKGYGMSGWMQRDSTRGVMWRSVASHTAAAPAPALLAPALHRQGLQRRALLPVPPLPAGGQNNAGSIPYLVAFSKRATKILRSYKEFYVQCDGCEGMRQLCAE